MLSNPITEAVSNRKGIAYVVSRMEWYWSLTELLLPVNQKNMPPAQLQAQLESHMVDLYKKLLLYQMKSVCVYYRNRVVVFLRDLVKLDDWDGALNDIRAAEEAVRNDSEQYNSQSVRSHLEELARTAPVMESQLGAIWLAIEAQSRLQEKTRHGLEDNKCLTDLRLTDPRDDKKRIEAAKGGLLKDSYRWILSNSRFCEWRDSPDRRLLWVRGDPGKGKTMLLCGVSNELKESTGPSPMAFFLCQATDSRINSATALLRGLIFVLVDEHRSLLRHVRNKYDQAGKSLFEDTNAFVALSGIFTEILHDAFMENAFLVIDALDECLTNFPQLLDLIISI